MIVLNFHRVEPPTGVEINRVSHGRFNRLLDVVQEHSSELSQPEDAEDEETEFCITFDDGFASITEHALPELQRRHINAAIFLISGFVGRDDSWDVRFLGRRRPMMSWRQVREWSDAGFSFGSHTCTHRDLTALTPLALKRELVDSKHEIEDDLGKAVTLLSYPFGRHTERVRDAARDAGYEGAFGLLRSVSGPFDIPRLNVHSLLTIRELRHALWGTAYPSWSSRLYSSLSAGSATVGNWWPRHRVDTTVTTQPVAS